MSRVDSIQPPSQLRHELRDADGQDRTPWARSAEQRMHMNNPLREARCQTNKEHVSGWKEGSGGVPLRQQSDPKASPSPGPGAPSRTQPGVGSRSHIHGQCARAHPLSQAACTGHAARSLEPVAPRAVPEHRHPQRSAGAPARAPIVARWADDLKCRSTRARGGGHGGASLAHNTVHPALHGRQASSRLGRGLGRGLHLPESSRAIARPSARHRRLAELGADALARRRR